MSMYLEFEPHSWYMGFAIKDRVSATIGDKRYHLWRGFTDDGNTYTIIEKKAATLKELKAEIKKYRDK